jgi:hypothetical protein
VVPHYLRGYGLIELSLDDCVARLDGAGLARRSTLRLEPASSREAAVEYLGHLTHPATRWALFAVNEHWTALVNNLRGGSDFADDMYFVSDICRARVCRVVDQDGGWRTIGDYRVRSGYPARIFELVEPGRTSFGDVARSIHAMLDGDRWDFAASGERRLPIEETFDYGARLKRDRFTSENLDALLASLGVEPPVVEAFETTARVFLVAARLENRSWRKAVEADAQTPAQADDPGYAYLQRGLDWIPFMKTHASSVVWDLTRAVLLNPELSEQARPHLDAARRRLGNTRFDELSQEAEEHLRTRGG